MIDLSHKKIIVTFLMHLGDLVLTTRYPRTEKSGAYGRNYLPCG